MDKADSTGSDVPESQPYFLTRVCQLFCVNSFCARRVPSRVYIAGEAIGTYLSNPASCHRTASLVPTCSINCISPVFSLFFRFFFNLFDEIHCRLYHLFTGIFYTALNGR